MTQPTFQKPESLNSDAEVTIYFDDFSLEMLADEECEEDGNGFISLWHFNENPQGVDVYKHVASMYNIPLGKLDELCLQWLISRGYTQVTSGSSGGA